MIRNDLPAAAPRLLPESDAVRARAAEGDGDLGIFDQLKLLVATVGRKGEDVPTTRATIRDVTSLSDLAERYGTTTGQLILLNKDNPSIFDLRAGDTIRVPLNRQVVTVQEGDTLRSLSRTYGIPADQIVEANGLAGGRLPPPGSQLALVPAASYGLGTKAAASAYVADVKTLEHQWNALEPSERLQKLEDAINERLAARGVPPVNLVVSGSGGGGIYDFSTHTIEVSSSVLSRTAFRRRSCWTLPTPSITRGAMPSSGLTWRASTWPRGALRRSWGCRAA